MDFELVADEAVSWTTPALTMLQPIDFRSKWTRCFGRIDDDFESTFSMLFSLFLLRNVESVANIQELSVCVE